MRPVLTVGLLCSLMATTLPAQSEWQATIEVGSTSFSSAAHDTNNPATNVHASLDGMYTLRFTRETLRSGIAIALSYSSGFFEGYVENFSVVPGDGIQLVEIAPEGRFAVGRTSTGATLWVHAGPVFDFWSVGGNDPNSRIGGLAGATLALPLSPRWRVDVRGDFAISASYADKEEEGPNLIRPSTMRRGRIALGITKKL